MDGLRRGGLSAAPIFRLQHVQAVSDAKGEIVLDINIASTSARAHQYAAGALKAPPAPYGCAPAPTHGRSPDTPPATHGYGPRYGPHHPPTTLVPPAPHPGAATQFVRGHHTRPRYR